MITFTEMHREEHYQHECLFPPPKADNGAFPPTGEIIQKKKKKNIEGDVMIIFKWIEEDMMRKYGRAGNGN